MKKVISNYEEKLLYWAEKNLFFLLIFLGIILGVAIRYTLKDFVSSDSKFFLLPWYEEIKNAGGLKGLGEQVGNYNILYQFLIAVMTYLPINPLTAYKGLSCIFDFLLAGLVGSIIYNLTKDRWKGIVGYNLVVFSPIVFLNSAAWAQCDSIYIFFAIFALVCLVREKNTWAFILLGISFAFKLQAIFFLPIFLFVYFRRKSFSLLYFAILPLVMCICGLPGVIKGRKILDIFTVYYEQQSTYRNMFLNYPSFWTFLCDGNSEESYLVLKNVAIIFTVIILAGIMIWWTVKKVSLTSVNLVCMTFVLVYSTVLFLPAMHERYSYCIEILSILLIFIKKETIYLSVAMHIVSMFTYGNYLFGKTINLNILSVINMTIYILFFAILMKYMLKNNLSKNNE